MEPYIKRYLEFCDLHDNIGWTVDDILFLKQNIEFLQHERLIHLLVLITTIFAFVFLCVASFLMNNIVVSIAGITATVLLLCYLRYYMILENNTQNLYKRFEKAWNSIH